MIRFFQERTVVRTEGHQVTIQTEALGKHDCFLPELKDLLPGSGVDDFGDLVRAGECHPVCVGAEFVHD